MKKGRILLLNGPSSAGKTTLAWELQTNAPGYWYWLTIDCFLDAVPSQQWDRDRDGSFLTAFDLHYDCVKLVSDQGMDIIMDTVICGRNLYESFEKKLAGYPVYMVKVVCPLEELNRRELARGDRETGLAAGQADIIVPQKSYDLIVDTYTQTTAECARQIIDMLEQPAGGPKAFIKLSADPNKWEGATHQREML